MRMGSRVMSSASATHLNTISEAAEKNQIYALEYQPDEGRQFATAGKDYKVRVYDEATKSLTHTLEAGWVGAPSGSPSCQAASSSGSSGCAGRLAAGDGGGVISRELHGDEAIRELSTADCTTERSLQFSLLEQRLQRLQPSGLHRFGVHAGVVEGAELALLQIEV